MNRRELLVGTAAAAATAAVAPALAVAPAVDVAEPVSHLGHAAVWERMWHGYCMGDVIRSEGKFYICIATGTHESARFEALDNSKS